LGFEKTLNLAQQSQKTLEFTSVTCDADNQSTTSLTSQAPTRIA
jgi:hypothetical protein